MLWREARRQKKQLAAQTQQKKAGLDKATIAVIVIVFVFYCLWAPYLVLGMVLSLSSEATATPYIPVKENLMLLGYVNSILNSVVYVFFNSRLRAKIRKSLGCKSTTIQVAEN